MLVKAKALIGYRLQSLDGDIGSAKEFYFDDRYWTIRYLVANTGTWLTGRKVLISPYSLNGIDTASEEISIQLTKTQIEGSPSIDSDRPVSRQFEDSYYGYYGFPYYWGGPCMWGYYPFPQRDRTQWGVQTGTRSEWDSHLRSTHTVTSYHLLARDGEIGHVEDFVVDDETWAIRYLIVATTDFWPGKKVLVPPQWIKSVSWEESKVVIDLSRETIKGAPEYTEGSLITRDHETGLYGYDNRPGYWVDELLPA
jgi:sporulation protein YlmC with PRC-barrel domain